MSNTMAAAQYASLKIGKLAQSVFGKMLEDGKASVQEIGLMQQAAYSKETFDLQFPVLVRADAVFDAKRYYAKPILIYGTSYMLCSQWYETPANNDRPYLERWIDAHETGTNGAATSFNFTVLPANGTAASSTVHPANGAAASSTVLPAQKKEKLPVELFRDEYYAPSKADGLNKGHWRVMAKYGDRIYYLVGYPAVVKSDSFSNPTPGGEKVLIKNPTSKMPKRGDDKNQIFVNECGIFIYGSGTNKGILCRLYDHDGNAKGAFELKTEERSNDKKIIKPSAYIVGSVFFCMSDEKIYKYDFAKESLETFRIAAPQEGKFDRLLVWNELIYLRCNIKWGSMYQWYVLNGTNGTFNPLFGNNAKYSAPFLFPRENIIWMTESGGEIYKECKLSGQTFRETGRRCKAKLEDVDVAYFDGDKFFCTEDSVVVTREDLRANQKYIWEVKIKPFNREKYRKIHEIIW